MRKKRFFSRKLHHTESHSTQAMTSVLSAVSWGSTSPPPLSSSLTLTQNYEPWKLVWSFCTLNHLCIYESNKRKSNIYAHLYVADTLPEAACQVHLDHLVLVQEKLLELGAAACPARLSQLLLRPAAGPGRLTDPARLARAAPARLARPRQGAGFVQASHHHGSRLREPHLTHLTGHFHEHDPFRKG